ncbi:hypothetical protein Sjap_016185 [Stephania japonica]|uniref:Uncharacterized protein n=1 Tax=Stephania japonica TaxID=461633 RepID=A0AAP0IKN0_9MAGN
MQTPHHTRLCRLILRAGAHRTYFPPRPSAIRSGSPPLKTATIRLSSSFRDCRSSTPLCCPHIISAPLLISSTNYLDSCSLTRDQPICGAFDEEEDEDDEEESLHHDASIYGFDAPT